MIAETERDMSERRDDIYQFDDAEIAAHPIVKRMVRDAVAARDAEIREALMSNGAAWRELIFSLNDFGYDVQNGNPFDLAQIASETLAKVAIHIGLAEGGAE